MDPLTVLTEPHRREVLRMTWDTEMTAGEIAGAFDITFGAVSQHLAKLRTAGFVEVRKEGTRRYYRASRDRLAPYTPILRAMWSTVLSDLATEAEALDA